MRRRLSSLRVRIAAIIAGLLIGWVLIDIDHLISYRIFHSMYLVYLISGLAFGLILKKVMEKKVDTRND